MSKRTATWPDRFVYVCSATKGNLVNILPLVQAGLDRIEGIYIFCGVADAHKPTADEIANAKQPSEQIKTFVRTKTASGRHLPVAIIYGDSEDIAIWRDEMNMICEAASSLGITIVYNITGGRKTMTIGAMFGARGRALLLSVNGREHVSEIFTEHDQHRLPSSKGLALEDYLAIYGRAETGSEKRKRREKKMLDAGDKILAFGKSLVRDKELNAICISASGDVNQREINISRHKYFDGKSVELVTRLLRELDGYLGIRGVGAADSAIFEAPTIEAHQFLRGGWLEAYVFVLLSRAFSGLNTTDVSFACNATYQNINRGKTGQTEREFDIAIMIADQLHVVECKAITSKEVGAESRNLAPIKLAELKSAILAQQGTVALLNPFIEPDYPERNLAFASRLDDAGITPLFGPDAGELLIEHVRSLIRAARPSAAIAR